eukprot:5201437-Amphidinium_carterae.1
MSERTASERVKRPMQQLRLSRWMAAQLVDESDDSSSDGEVMGIMLAPQAIQRRMQENHRRIAQDICIAAELIAQGEPQTLGSIASVIWNAGRSVLATACGHRCLF